MKVLSFGSLNIDYTYQVDHIVQPKETISSFHVSKNIGGKGLNQAIACAKAGCDTYLAGQIGNDGAFLLDTCSTFHVNTDFVKVTDMPTGHAIIQLDKNGQNSIVLFSGANRTIEKNTIENVLSHFEKGDILLLQNEINHLNYIIDKAFDKGLRIVLNPSPFDERILDCDLNKVSYFFINEVEGEAMTGKQDAQEILKCMLETYPNANVVLTLGEKGSMFANKFERIQQSIYSVDVVDTTGAGDTYTGYFIASILSGKTIQEAMNHASFASSITVSRIGAAISIPTKEELKR